MPDYVHSNPFKIQLNDSMIASTGTIGHLTLIDNTLLSSAVFTADAPTDVLTFTVATQLVTGSRIRLTSTTTLPGGTLSSTDYFVIYLTATTIKLATTLANAMAGTALNITDSGSGTLTANEQALTVNDSLAAIVSHEIISAAISPRRPITNVGVSTIVNGDAQKTPWITAITNSTNANIVFGYKLVVFGGTGAIGDSSVGTFMLQQEVLTIASGAANSISITFRRAV